MQCTAARLFAGTRANEKALRVMERGVTVSRFRDPLPPLPSSPCAWSSIGGGQKPPTGGTRAAPVRHWRLLEGSGPARLEASPSLDGAPRSSPPVPVTATRQCLGPVLSPSAKTSIPEPARALRADPAS